MTLVFSVGVNKTFCHGFAFVKEAAKMKEIVNSIWCGFIFFSYMYP